MLTWMIHSEISGLLRTHIHADHIMVQQSIVRGVESATLKTRYRIRKVPMTERIRNILDEVLARTDSPYVFAQPDGKPYLRENFTERTWTRAITKCNISYRPPYSIRHSFAAWSLLVGIEPLRLVKLMGHGSKQMVYEVYGNYLDGLETDYWEILNYFGKDFIEVKKRPLSYYQNLPGESLVKAWGLKSITS
jgi:integrase